jgi:amino acid transporter
MNRTQPEEESLGFWPVVSLGVGGMVGGGIFAVLGFAVELAHGATPIAFALAGIVALVTSYSYVKLSVRYPSRGGTVEFLNRAFGPGMVTGGLNVLLWLSYIVMLSLYASAFGSYGAVFFPESMQAIAKHGLISGIVLLLTGLNAMGARIVGECEEWIVGFKIFILLLFIGIGLASVNPDRLQVSTWSSPVQVLGGGMIIFLAYEGFELIANTAGEVREPKKMLPRAFYSSVGFVMVLYILVSLVAVGNLPVDQIVSAKDYALAVAARPFLGAFGFTLIAIAALLSTASAINATLYGTSRISYIIAKEGELPRILEKKIWKRPVEGLLITSALTLIVANLFDLSSISMMGSAGFLILFAAVNGSNLLLRRTTEARGWIAGTGIGVCGLALLVLIWQTAMESPRKLWILVLLVGTAFTVEALYRKASGRRISPNLTRGDGG